MAEYRVPNLKGFEWQKAVLDKDLSTPPSSPSNGDRYLIASGATGSWSGHDGDITWYEDGSWYFIPKKEGMFVYVKDEDKLYYYNGSSWQEFTSGSGGSDSDWVVGSGVIYNLNDNVGIGESNPLYKLHIRKDVSSQLDPAVVFFNNSLPEGKYVTMKFGQALSTNCCGILGFSKDTTNGSRVWLCVQGDDGNAGTSLTVHKGGIVSIDKQSACSIKLSSSQSVSSGSNTIVHFNVKEFDTQNEFDTSSYKFTASEDGIYAISVGIEFSTNTSGGRVVMITKNGNYISRSDTNARTATSTTTVVHLFDVLKLSKNDYIQIQVYQDSGSSLSILNSNYTHFRTVKVA